MKIRLLVVGLVCSFMLAFGGKTALANGPQLLANNDFNSGLTSWSYSGAAVYDSSDITLNSGGYISQSVTWANCGDVYVKNASYPKGNYGQFKVEFGSLTWNDPKQWSSGSWSTSEANIGNITAGTYTFKVTNVGTAQIETDYWQLYCVPTTATSTPTATATVTNTPIPPTATYTPTFTPTPIPPTVTLTPIPTSTFTLTPSPIPTNTYTPIPTQIPPTATWTPLPTNTPTPIPPTLTTTPLPTDTLTPVPATSTATSSPLPTAVPPTGTRTPTLPPSRTPDPSGLIAIAGPFQDRQELSPGAFGRSIASWIGQPFILGAIAMVAALSILLFSFEAARDAFWGFFLKAQGAANTLGTAWDEAGDGDDDDEDGGSYVDRWHSRQGTKGNPLHVVLMSSSSRKRVDSGESSSEDEGDDKKSGPGAASADWSE